MRDSPRGVPGVEGVETDNNGFGGDRGLSPRLTPKEDSGLTPKGGRGFGDDMGLSRRGVDIPPS